MHKQTDLNNYQTTGLLSSVHWLINNRLIVSALSPDSEEVNPVSSKNNGMDTGKSEKIRLLVLL